MMPELARLSKPDITQFLRAKMDLFAQNDDFGVNMQEMDAPELARSPELDLGGGNSSDVGWKVADSFYAETDLASLQRQSFDYFISSTLPHIFLSADPIREQAFSFNMSSGPDTPSKTYRVVHQMKFNSINVESPYIDGTQEALDPSAARLRDLTYSGRIMARVTYQVVAQQVFTADNSPAALNTTDTNADRIDNLVRKNEAQLGDDIVLSEYSVSDVEVGRIPIMLRTAKCHLSTIDSQQEIAQSGECLYDRGGYFVVNGSEKAIIAQESIRNNHVFVFNDKQESKHTQRAEIKSQTRDGRRVFVLNMKRMAGNLREGEEAGRLVVEMKNIQYDFPLQVLMRALGVEDDQTVLNLICSPTDFAMMDAAMPTLRSHARFSQASARKFIGEHLAGQDEYTEEQVDRFLDQQILPHIGDTDDCRFKKAAFLCSMANKTLSVHLRRRGYDDRDHYANKRVQLAGPLLERLISQIVNQAYIKDVKRMVHKSLRKAEKLQKFPERKAGLTAEAETIIDYISKCASDPGSEFVSCRPVKPEAIRQHFFASQVLSTKLNQAFSTGTWTADQRYDAAKGVTQNLDRLTFASSVSCLRRVNSGTGDATGKNPKLHMLHNTQWGVICPAETPEGKKCGLTKNIALLTRVTRGGPYLIPGKSSTKTLQKRVAEIIAENLNDTERMDVQPSRDFLPHTMVAVVVDGVIEMYVRPNAAERLIKVLRDYRRYERLGEESMDVSILYNREYHEIRVTNDCGRCTRPLFVLRPEPATRKPTLLFRQGHLDRIVEGLRVAQGHGTGWLPRRVEESGLGPAERDFWEFRDLVRVGVVEMVDVEEEEQQLIYLSLKEYSRNDKPNTHTHCEIHPASIFGAIGGLVPFPEHNQSPRNTYSCAMAKQAMGVYASSYRVRMDTQAHVLYYPQRPLVRTHQMSYVRFEELPAGINSIVAILCYGGFNQEDSVLMNMFAVDRGFFRSSYYSMYSAKVAVLRGENGMAPPKVVIAKPARNDILAVPYSKLDDDGLVHPGSEVSGALGDVIIGRQIVTPAVKVGDRDDVRLSPIYLKKTDEGFIDTVMLTVNSEGRPLIKVKLRSLRIPQVGDKFSSRHGQKGTCGMLYRQSDMPFSRAGISPDIIINPHAIPSRMTIGQLKECVFSKLAAVAGDSNRDGTVFSDHSAEEVAAQLHARGYHRYGNERLMSGHYGTPLGTMVFIGPTFYQRLKHMVTDKLNARATGQMQLLMRQPTEGRSRHGGLRFGEMERDCIVAHGAAAFLADRFCFSSDAHNFWLCANCGFIFAGYNANQSPGECAYCRENTRAKKFTIPYSTKLVFQELMAMGIAPRIELAQNSNVQTKLVPTKGSKVSRCVL